MNLWKTLHHLLNRLQRWWLEKTMYPSSEMNLLKMLHHLCKGARDDDSKTMYPSPEKNQRWMFEKSFTISEKVPEMIALKQRYHLQEMRAWKTLHHLCKGARDDDLKTMYPSPEMNLWKKLHHLQEMRAWKTGYHLQRWIFEKSFTISKRCELEKRVIISREMVAVNLRHHLHGDDTLFFVHLLEMRS